LKGTDDISEWIYGHGKNDKYVKFHRKFIEHHNDWNKDNAIKKSREGFEKEMVGLKWADWLRTNGAAHAEKARLAGSLDPRTLPEAETFYEDNIRKPHAHVKVNFDKAVKHYLEGWDSVASMYKRRC
jgi:hypothetical protein